MALQTNINIDETTLNHLMDMHGLQRIRLAYDGEITIGNVETILELLNSGFNDWQNSKGSGRALRIAVEILQNVAKHTLQSAKSSSYVMLYSAEDRLFMTTCNRISSRDKKIIEDTFDLIQDYTLDQLRDAYRTALTNASFNEKGGAGLGLLDIAYRTQRVPEHAFKQVTGQDAFDFFIKVNLNLE